MTPQEYDAWYASPRGAWIGETEYVLLRRLLGATRRSTVLDIGCGTGYFSRRFACDGHPVTGVDLDSAMVEFARTHAAAGETYRVADAQALPFGDRTFDYCVSVSALCFVRDEREALEEMVRVARRGVALGLLNRHSLLYWQKGRRGGSGAYRGAHWHTVPEARRLLAGLPLHAVLIRSAVYFPSASSVARCIEARLPGRLPFGAFLAVAANRS